MHTSYHRGRWEGVANIVRFNWHFYVLALGMAAIGFLTIFLPGISVLFKITIGAAAAFAVFYLFISLWVSHYIYDCSDLYRLDWLNQLPVADKGCFVNVHSGFDETSRLLKAQYVNANWTILDFYNPEIHTEISIARARRYKPVLPETQAIQPDQWSLPSASVTTIFGILAVHEIRRQDQKVAFFNEAYRVLEKGGCFILVEHLRNPANFLAYGPGFLHFFSERIWNEAFTTAGFYPMKGFYVTPFIKVFVLTKK